MERLQKVLAAAGLGSRRQCEELITAGRVEVDRRVVTELGTRVDPAKQQVRVDGEALHTAKLEYFALNKPSGVLCTNRDPSGRTRAVDLVPARGARLFTIGRLDLHSDGLILVTNDGDLANGLMHPRYEVEKTYEALVAGSPSGDDIKQLLTGVWLSDGRIKAKAAKKLKRQGDSVWLRIVLCEGKNREIRRMLAKLGHKVMRLRRTAIGPVRLDRLPKGKSRKLALAEIQSLKKAVPRQAKAESV